LRGAEGFDGVLPEAAGPPPTLMGALHNRQETTLFRS
jgi:hypothetical protein